MVQATRDVAWAAKNSAGLPSPSEEGVFGRRHHGNTQFSHTFQQRRKERGPHLRTKNS